MAVDVIMSGFYFHIDWLLPRFWWQRFWWNSISGTTITLPWGGTGSSVLPPDEWKDWLNKHVGRKGWDWDWRLSYNPNNPMELRFGLIDIKFRKGKDEFAALVLLKWSKK